MADMIEMAVVAARGLAGELAASPRVGDDGRVRDRVVFSGDEIGKGVRARLDQLVELPVAVRLYPVRSCTEP
jgi:hypothetical protein